MVSSAGLLRSTGGSIWGSALAVLATLPSTLGRTARPAGRAGAGRLELGVLGELSLELLDVESEVIVSEPTGTSAGGGACTISWSSGIESNPWGMIYDAASEGG